MAKGVMSRAAFTDEVSRSVPKFGPATAKAEQHAHKTGKLNPLVDPAGFGVIRRSLPRFEEQPDGTWKMAVGTPIPIEVRLDTTGSMGGNVDIALGALPQTFDLCASVLPGYDPQVSIGIFGDVCDPFVLCRPQFEMDAKKIVEQLMLQVPCRDGGDTPEDPHYGLFGAAYLTAPYINRIGLRGYDFTTSDAPARDRLDESQLVRIYGKEVFDKVVENGYQVSKSDLPTTREIVRDLLKRTHAFFLQVGEHHETTEFWSLFGRERMVVLPETKLLPQVMATIIGLTEGTLDLQTVSDFLQRHNVIKEDAMRILRSVSNIPIGAQAELPNFSKRPQRGDVFAKKTDLWPMDPEAAVIAKPEEPYKPGKRPAKWL